MTAVASVPIRGDVIRLGQFLKVADAVDQGSDVKALLATGAVYVNGEVEPRRGRQLHVGDLVTVGTTGYRIVAPPAEQSVPGVPGYPGPSSSVSTGS